MTERSADRTRLVLVGPGFHLLGGLSVYTCRLAQALQERFDVSVLLLNKIVPTRLYPGGARAGQPLTSLDYTGVPVRGRVDWHGRGLLGAVVALWRLRPELLVLQWWTAATLHLYLVLALVARLRGIRTVIEFHEIQDTGEAAVPFVAGYCRRLMPWLIRAARGGIVHNRHDADLLRDSFGATLIDRLALQTAPHGPYDHLGPALAEAPAQPEPETVRLLYFGLIRPYKGLEDLIRAFDGLHPDEVARFRLTVVGETWENWTLPTELAAASPYRHRITVVNRYVSDAEAAQFFAEADAVVLPYRRGSASGPLQIAMSNGLHVLMYAVGGLVEAVRDYPGARLVEPGSVTGLTAALRELVGNSTRRFEDPHSWQATTEAYATLGDRLRS